tara:strand:+ start:380 stop:1312 length:933 start_codon:yes stop_codon:yes gene_type:complete
LISGWVAAQFAALAHALPNPKAESWKRLTSIADWLVGYCGDAFTSKQLVVELYGEPNAGQSRSLGRLLSSLPSRPKSKRTSRMVNGRRISCDIWSTAEVRQILRDHAVILSQESGKMIRNPAMTGVYASDSAETTIPPLGTMNIRPSSLIRSFGIREMQILDGIWRFQHARPYSFTTSLKVVHALLDNSIWERKNGQDDQFPCLRFTAGTKDNGYVSINNWWLERLFPEETITIDDLPTKTASRLVAMVEFPEDLKDWASADGRNRHVHHLCRTRNCILPKHLMILKAGTHKHIHMINGEPDHPAVQPVL